ncbi:asparagine synthase C-terminal domain-containing protein [Mangrovimonas sp. DI 80]|uniref:asparagine synthase C-terminal domain-containing protein n=1 Tax=Mangrovimonas sp. DI 80 TaxID=1779330 RepID=UPI000978148F|nr:asparagine synthase C-terminal domain-containing protein [Mangrovimonas sp. DI 80]OMP31169.1 asparagine synthase [Mangrovimonas sp. DI 80]
MKEYITPIIPHHQTFAKVQGAHELHLEAICLFTAIGFFLDTDTYWKDQIVLRPAGEHEVDAEGYLQGSKPYFKWEYRPKDLKFSQALERYGDLLEEIVGAQVAGQEVILPLSGGLDSRTLAVALQPTGASVATYSYDFAGGYPETVIAKKLAKKAGMPFKSLQISNGYLWERLDELANLNGCFTDFCSPRQMAVTEQLKDFGDLFLLGHWGDVLFDDMKVPDSLPFEQQLEVLQKKLLKPGGLELAQQLWQLWGLKGTFKAYLRERVASLLKAIDIPESANAQIRAFKSLYWAPRWTSINLSVFERVHPIVLPYYDNRMCEFITTIPEAFLKGRQLQIAYIQQRAPQLAKVTWQDQRPFHLNNYHWNKPPYNWPYRIINKAKRTVKQQLGTPYIQRNWELQFLGAENQEALEAHLWEAKSILGLPQHFIKEALGKFCIQPNPQTAHTLNMLLVLALFSQKKEYNYT